MIAVRFVDRMRSAVRRPARKLLTPGPTTAPLMQPVGPQVPDDQHVQQVLDLCMRMGEVLLASGEGSGETTDTMLRVANAFGLATVDVDITFTAVTICCHRGMAATPITSLRVVKYRALDLTLLATVYRLVEDVERGRLDLLATASALDRAVKAVHPYPRWVATAGLAGLAGAVALLLGAPWVAVPVAAVITAVIDVIGRLLAHRRLPAFYRQVLGGFIATGATTAFIGIGVLPEGTEAALVVAAGITVLLSGFAVVSTVQDAIGGYAVTAAGRAAEIAVASAGLLSGVVLGLKLAQRAGVQLDVAAELPADGTQITTALLASAAAAAFYAVGGYAAPQALLFAALAGAAGLGSFVLLSLVGLGPVAASGGAAIVVGVAAGLLRRRGRVPLGSVPPLVIALAGIVPLLPGLTAYRGFYQLAVEGVADGLVTVTLALAIGLALAAGVALGQYLVRPNAIPLSSLPPPPPAERG
jgi:uncharacterized membrane protein YjjP (DUF1212 family)/uncharacterized membrane protein YjjB (DUF3815 family)